MPKLLKTRGKKEFLKLEEHQQSDYFDFTYGVHIKLSKMISASCVWNITLQFSFKNRQNCADFKTMKSRRFITRKLQNSNKNDWE